MRAGGEIHFPRRESAYPPQRDLLDSYFCQDRMVCTRQPWSHYVRIFHRNDMLNLFAQVTAFRFFCAVKNSENSEGTASFHAVLAHL